MLYQKPLPANLTCCMCNVAHNNLDDRLYDSQILKYKFWRNDFAGIQDLGYCPCYENIL